MSETESRPKTAPQQETGGDCNPRLVLPSSGELLGDWYECAPYGEQVPDDLQRLLAQFLTENGKPTDDAEAWCIISESTPDDTWLKLFECIFAEGARFAMQTLENRDLLRENSPDQPLGISRSAASDCSPS